MNFKPESEETFFEHLNRGPLQRLWHDDQDQPDELRRMVRPGPVGDAAARAPITSSTVVFWRTIIARVVNGYRHGQHLGKVGLALQIQSNNNDDSSDIVEAVIFTNDDCGVKLTVYRSKHDVIHSLELRPAKGFGDPPVPSNLRFKNHHLHFDDLEKLSWSMGFLTDADERDFLKELRTLFINVQVGEEMTMEVHTIDKSSNDRTEANTLKESAVSAIGEELRTRSKSKLISRISRVGQALPNLTRSGESNEELASEAAAGAAIIRQVGSISSESETEVIITPAAKPRTFANAQTTTATVMPTGIVREFRNNRNINNNSSSSSNQNNNDFQHSKPDVVHNDLFQLLCTEQRNESCELRINLSRMDFKLDKVLDRLERLERNVPQSTASNGKTCGVDNMAREWLLLRDQDVSQLEKRQAELLSENQRLKQQIEEQANVIASMQNDQAAEVASVFHKYDEQFKVLLPDQPQMQLADVIGKLIDLLEQPPLPCETCERLVANTCLNTDEIIELCRNHEDITRENNQLAIALTNMAQNHAKNEEEREQNEICNIKGIMNRLYAMLAEKLPQGQDELLGMIAKTIKAVTIEYEELLAQQKQ